MFWYNKIRSQLNKMDFVLLYTADNSKVACIVFPIQKIPNLSNRILRITVHIWVRKGMLPHSQANSIF